MEIKCRTVSKYMDVKIIHGDVTIELGLHDDDERIALAKELIAGAEALMPATLDNTQAAEKSLENVRHSL